MELEPPKLALRNTEDRFLLKCASAKGLGLETCNVKIYSCGDKHFSPYGQQPWTQS